jgi:biopolymer transport protein ExbD
MSTSSGSDSVTNHNEASGDGPVGDGTAPYAGWPAELQLAAANAPKRKSKRGKRKPLTTPPISITSLTDCVTLLLVYLLKSFTTSPIEIKEPAVQLPVSTSKDKIEDASVVMLTGPIAQKTVQGQRVEVSMVPRIVVDGKDVLALDEKTYRVPDDQKDKASGGYVILALRDALKKAKESQEITRQVTGKEFQGKVIILADKHTPYRVLTDVLVTCGEAGFGDFRFAVIRPD